MPSEFEANVKQYLSSNLVDNTNIASPAVISALNAMRYGHFIFEPSDSDATPSSVVKRRILRQTAQPKISSIEAYWCPFISGGTEVGYVDVPRTPDEGRRCVFTPAMQGCALIVAPHPTDPSLMRVFHHQHPDKPGPGRERLDKYVAAHSGKTSPTRLGYADYASSFSANEVANAFVGLHHNGSDWHYFAQANQILPNLTLTPKISQAIIYSPVNLPR